MALTSVRKEEEKELRPTWSRAAIPLRRQQSVPHSGVREALLAPMAAPALPDVVRSSSCVREEKEEELQPYHFHRQPTTDNRQPTSSSRRWRQVGGARRPSPTGCFEFWWARRPPSLNYALLAPRVAPALPDVERSSSCVREERPSWHPFCILVGETPTLLELRQPQVKSCNLLLHSTVYHCHHL